MSIESYPSPNGVLTSLIWRKTMSGGETSLSGYDNASQALSYTPGQEQVYLNGILLVRGDDYTATNGTTITGLTALAASDYVQVNCYNNFSVASVPAQNLTGTVTNAQLANSTITINGSAVSLGGTVSKTLVATDSTQYIVPSQTGNSGKYLTTNGTASSWASPVPAVSVATTLNTYTAFSAQPLGGQTLNVSTNSFYLSQYGSYTQSDADIFNAAFPSGSVITATSATQTGTFTTTGIATINGGGYIIVNITTSEPSTIFFSGATTLTAGVSTSGKYLTNNGSASSWGTVDLTTKTDKSTLTTTGDIYYASSANTPSRRAIGTTGQVLTVSGGVPTWATPSSSGSHTLLSTTTLGTATTTVSSISQSYKHLYIEILGIDTSNFNPTINYQCNSTNLVFNATQAAATTGANYYTTGGTVGNTQNYGGNYGSSYNKTAIHIYDYTDAVNPKVGTFNQRWINEGGAPILFNGQLVTGTAAVTTFSMVVSTGSYDGGTIKIYGVN